MTDISTLFKRYETAWNERNATQRRALLDQCWAQSGVYTDPTAQTHSRHALCDHLGAFLDGNPGHALRVVSGVDEHHGQVRFEWQVLDAGGAVAIAGMSHGHVGDDGLIVRMTGFFGPFPSAF
jgi:SnoaL-like domain